MLSSQKQRNNVYDTKELLYWPLKIDKNTVNFRQKKLWPLDKNIVTFRQEHCDR